MLSLLSWAVCGFLVGLLARALVPGRQALGCLPTVALGVAGAFVGGLLSTAVWPTWANEPDANRMWPGWLMSIIGATLLLVGYVALVKPGGPRA